MKADRQRFAAIWRPRLIAGVALLALLGLVAGAVYTYLSYRTTAAELIVQRDREVARVSAIRLHDELDKLAGELEPTARSQSLYLGLTGKQRAILRGQTQRLSMFDGGVILMDNSGRVRDTLPERWEIMSSDWSNQEFFKRMLVSQPTSRYFSSVLDVGPENSQVIVVSVPVLGPNGETVGVLAGLFRLGESRTSALYASVVRLRLAGSGNTYIADSAGRVIYDSAYKRTGQTIDLERMRAAVEGEPKPQADPDGNEVVVSYSEIPGTDWMLVTETDWVDAMAPVQRLATGMIVLLALGMVIPTAGVALLARGQRHAAVYSDQSQTEARISKALRQNLLPRYTPMLGGWELAVHHRGATSSATAHDLYDFMLLPDGRLMLSLATVAARGLAAPHLMTTIRAAFRTVACRIESTPAVSAGHALSVCNNLLCPEVGPDAAVTSLFALLDPVSGRLQIANAGFCAPFKWSLNGGSQNGRLEPELIEMREGADFLGQQLDVEYDHDDVLLAPGESMIFYSPGALGIRPHTGEPFGPERVRRVLGALVAHANVVVPSISAGGAAVSEVAVAPEAPGAQAMVDALRTDIDEFGDDDSLKRLDVTLLVLSRPPAAQPAGKPGSRRSLRDELAALGETDTDL